MSIEVILSCLVPYARNHVLWKQIRCHMPEIMYSGGGSVRGQPKLCQEICLKQVHEHTLSYCSKCQEIQTRIKRKGNADGHTIVMFSYCITREARFEGRAQLWRLLKIIIKDIGQA